MLLAIDPGVCSPGIALFHQNGCVHARAVAAPDEWVGTEDGLRWLRVGRLIVGAVAKMCGPKNAAGDQHRIEAIVYEKPQWYQRKTGGSKGNPNKLVGIAGVACNVTGALSMLYPELVVRSPTPAEWIGQLPKVCPVCDGKASKKCAECHGSAWETPRGRRIRSRLTPGELALIPDQNDAIDAVGIGLWAVGRLVPHSVFSNGRDGR